MNSLAQVWPFINPAFAGVAVAAGLIPVLIHLIHRRRYTRMPWAAMRFLLAASRRSAKRVWLEQFLLLATRIAVIVLFGLAVARPYMPASGLLPFRASSVHRILMLNNSLSMNAALEDGRTRFAAAKQAALTLLDSFPASDAVSLVTLAEPAEAQIGHPAHDRRFVRDQLSALESTFRSDDAVGAMKITMEILKESDYPPGNRVVYLVSDLPRHVWSADLSDRAIEAPIPSQTHSALASPAVIAARGLADLLPDPSWQWVVVHVSPGPSRNLAVTGLEQVSPLFGADIPARFVATAANFSSRPASGWLLQIRVGGRILRTDPLPEIPPRDSRTTPIATEFATPGTHLIEARLLPAGTRIEGTHSQNVANGDSLAETEVDALADDNVRYLSVELRHTRAVLLVDGRPGSGAPGSSGETAFLATAIAPRVRIDRGLHTTLFKPKVVTDAELESQPLGDYDVIALCNVRRLSADNWNRLEAYVRAGGSLMVFPGELVDAENYNEFGYAEGNSVLPVRLLSAHRADSRNLPLPYGRGSDSGRGPENGKDGEFAAWVGFASTDLTHPIVAEFSGRPESSLFTARVEQYFRIDTAAPVSAQAHVVLRYTDGAEALIASSLERGRILLFTTTVNMDWTNLPAKGDYVSLMLNSLAWLAPQHGQHRNLRIGQTVQERLSAVESSLPLQIIDAHGAVIEPRLVPDEDAMLLEYGPVERPGPVQVSIGQQTRTFAANVDPAESDLRTMDEASFRSAMARDVRFIGEAGAPFPAHSGPATPTGPTVGYATELAPMPLTAVFGLLLVESLLAMWFGAGGRESS